MSVMVGLEERSMGKRKICSVGLEERSMEKRRFVASALESCPASKFVSIVTDDLLMEILLRLPHARAVIQCGSVCKRWFSILSDLHFIRQFNQFHSHIKPPSSRSPPYAILFRSAYCSIRIYEAFSEKSKILFGARRSINDNYLNFMPHPLTVKGSWKDLLLIDTNYQDYCLYNPLTRQQLVLPLPPRGNYFCGFLCEPKDSQLCYKILKIASVIENESEYVLDALVFCSETGKWCQSTLSCPRTLAPTFTDWGDCVASNGILYSRLQGREEFRGFAAFGLSKFSSTDGDPIRIRFIHLPNCFSRGWWACPEYVYHGVVQGCPRLSQVVKKKSGFVVKVWELYHNNDNDIDNIEWLLVHEVTLKRNDTNTMFVVAFHPNKGDVIFVFCDNDLYKYKIGKEKYTKIGQLPDCERPKHVPDNRTRNLHTFTLVHPSWPTLIPALPGRNS